MHGLSYSREFVGGFCRRSHINNLNINGIIYRTQELTLTCNCSDDEVNYNVIQLSQTFNIVLLCDIRFNDVRV